MGASLGAGLIGLGLGSVGMGIRWLLGVPDAARTPGTLLLVAGLALIGGLRDLRLIWFHLPQPARQVPRGWLEAFGPRKTGFLWGLAIGLAYSTMIQYSLYYVVALWVIAMADPLLGAAALGVYGLTQGALLVIDVAAMGLDPGRREGLLGAGRTAFFFRFGGVALLACAVFLFRASAAGVFTAPTRSGPGADVLSSLAGPPSPVAVNSAFQTRRAADREGPGQPDRPVGNPR
jgi:hypothetical protein